MSVHEITPSNVRMNSHLQFPDIFHAHYLMSTRGRFLVAAAFLVASVSRDFLSIYTDLLKLFRVCA